MNAVPMENTMNIPPAPEKARTQSQNGQQRRSRFVMGKDQRVVSLKEVRQQVSGSAPLLIMVGSLTGCSKKDAINYAKGLAEKYVTSSEDVWFNVEKDEARDRYVFEIHEGGKGFSILERALEQIELVGEIYIELANGKHVVLEEVNGQIYSLVAPENDANPSAKYKQSVAIDALFGKKKIKPLYANYKRLMNAGLLALGFGLSVFAFSLTVYVLSNSAFMDHGLLVRSQVAAGVEAMNDNPIIHLDKVKREAKASHSYVTKLTKDNNGWRWELGK